MKPPSPAVSIKRAQEKAKREHLELAYLAVIRAANLPSPTREVQLIQGRKWSWDFVYEANRIAIEIQGQTHKIGAHSSHAGLARDYEKGNAANIAGWCCLSFSADHIASGYALETTKQALAARPAF